MSEQESGASGPIIIKKYANRRLYNTQTSSYVTLDHLCEMVKKGVEFEVHDARTGDNITRQVLAQIIFDEENKGQHLLPIQFLRQLIGFYGDSLQAFVPSYLEMSMDSFSKLGYKDFEQLTRQNIAMFEQAVKMFSPFGNPMNPMSAWTGQNRETPNPFAAAAAAFGGAAKAASEPSSQRDQEIRDLKDQLAAMRQQIADLAQRK